MAPGIKSRTTKQRSTSGGGSSTITIFVCIALSLLLLWLLTSNTIAPPQTTSTSRAAMKTSPIKPITSSRSNHEPLTHEAHHVDHEDIPTHIPDALPINKETPHDDDTSKDDLQPKTTTDDNTEKPNTTDNTSNTDDPEPKTDIADDNTSTNDDVEPKTTDIDDNKSNNDVDADPKTDIENTSNNDVVEQKTTDIDDQNTSNNDVAETKIDDNAASNSDNEPKTGDIDNTSNIDSEPKITDIDNTSNNDIEPKTKETSAEVEGEQQSKVKSTQTSSEEESETKQTNVEEENQQPEDEKQSEVTEKDNQQRIGKHHEKQDQIQIHKHELHSRDTHGAISHDQVAHNNKAASDDDANSQVGNETKKTWSTQADQSNHENERRKSDKSSDGEHTWRLCNVTAGADYIPCLDNEKAIARLHSRKHHEHRERHCPEDAPSCLVPMPNGYKTRIDWPQSRDKIWYHNVPHTMLAEVKGHQNWVKVTGEFLTFPGGGTQFIHGALHYIDFVQEAVPNIAWGKHTRVVLDVGCGVASLGGYLFERDVIAMSLAPKDEHEAQVQMALERGIPAISAVMGSQRLPFPSRVFDIVHCARCRVPWHADGGALLLELNRVLRPGGYFVWSATPVYQKLEEDVQIWNEMSNLTVAMCWELVTIKKDALNSIGAAIYQKPETNECYEQRKQNEPPMCKSEDDPNAAWYIPLQSCMHRIPLQENERGSQWPEEWPDRLQTPPYWLNKTQPGIYGKPAPDDFASDFKHWKKMVTELYMEGLGVSWAHVRNVMDMRAVYGGFAAALRDLKVWVMNVVNVDSPDTLPLIYERGLFGIYHDWCESFSTYPRTYDLLHADHLFSTLKTRCNMVMVMAEIDRIVRPGGILIVRDDSETIGEVDVFLKSLHWEVNIPKNQEAGILAATKSDWRPDSYADQSRRLAS